MLANAKFAAVLSVLILGGCASKLSNASGSEASMSAFAGGSGSPRREPVPDPSLNDMAAASYNVPAKWHFEGMLMQASPCLASPSLVARATSPDGLSYVEDLPTYAWTWTEGFNAKNQQQGCLSFKSEVKPQEFLKYLSSAMNLEYVSDDPLPPEILAALEKGRAEQKAKDAQFYAASHLQAPQNSVEMAAATVRYKNGTFVMKGQLSAPVNCTAVFHKGMKSILRGMADTPDWTAHSCFAQPRLIVAPQDRFDSIFNLIKATQIGPTTNPEWAEARRKRMFEQSRQAMNQFAEQDRQRAQAQAQQFAHDQAVRQQMHEQFLSNLQAGTDRSMARAAEVSQSNHRMAQDVVDYSLDRQTVRDPNTGQISKVSSAYSYTWVDNSGKVAYQTTDPNANPNGSLQGSWTRQQVVHGDGSQ